MPQLKQETVSARVDASFDVTLQIITTALEYLRGVASSGDSLYGEFSFSVDGEHSFDFDIKEPRAIAFRRGRIAEILRIVAKHVVDENPESVKALLRAHADKDPFNGIALTMK